MEKLNNSDDYYIDNLTHEVINEIIRENYDKLVNVNKKAPESRLLCISYPSINSLLRRIRHGKKIDNVVGILRNPYRRVLRHPVVQDVLNDQNMVCIFICIVRPKNRSNINICAVKSILLSN